VLSLVRSLARRRKVLFVMHPRTKAALAGVGFLNVVSVSVVSPLGYIEFIAALDSAAAIVTDRQAFVCVVLMTCSLQWRCSRGINALGCTLYYTEKVS
jgi:hypothetical protein